jgi:hypothetical protein
MIIASNPTAAIPMIKKANAAGSCSSQYLCTRMNVPYPRHEHQFIMEKVNRSLICCCSPATSK